LLVSLLLLALLLLTLLLLTLRLGLLGLVRVEWLALTVALALRRSKSLMREPRLDLALGRKVALVALRMPISTTRLSAITLVALAIMLRLVTSAGAIALVAANAASLVVTATATVAATSWATRRRFVGGSIDADRATIEFNVVHGLDGGVGFTVLGEAHEAKAAAAASIAILNHDGLFDLAKLLKLGSESHIIGMPGEAANEDFGHDEK